MHVFTDTRVPIDARSALAEDLRSWLPARRVLSLATEAAGLVTQDPAFRTMRFEQCSAPMMLTLLGYCYATNRFSSEDVEEAVANEDVLRHSLGFSDAHAIRRFRRAYRPWILQCLIYILTEAKAESAERAKESFATVCSGACEDIVGWSSRRIQLAILMDAAEAD